MTAPTIHGVTFDKTLYEKGDTITATVSYTSTNTSGGEGDLSYELNVTATDPATGETTDAGSNAGGTPFTFVIDSGPVAPDPLDFTATDNRTPPGTWAVASDDHAGTAVLTSTA